MSTCPHASEVNKPIQGVPIHREECCQCFHSPKSPGGLELCMVCFTGGCPSPSKGGQGHADNHYRVTKHHIYLHLVEKDKPTVVEPATSDIAPVSVPPATLNDLLKEAEVKEAKLAGSRLALPTELSYTAHCRTCAKELSLDPTINPKLAEAVPLVISSISSSSALADPATGAPRTSSGFSSSSGSTGGLDDVARPCPHTLKMAELQSQARAKAPNGLLPDLSNASLNKCSSEGCSIAEDLWLCLECGALGCSRPNYDGTGGKGHAVAHSQTTGHSVVMKVATLTAAGTADLWCYGCDAEVIDPELGHTLEAFGISLHGRVKTGKSMAELQIERNTAAASDSVFDLEGRRIHNVKGPGVASLENIGNSCYMNSLLQALMAARAKPNVMGLRERYFTVGQNHHKECTNSRPANCFLCQMSKFANALQQGTGWEEGEAAKKDCNDDESSHSPKSPKYDEYSRPTMRDDSFTDQTEHPAHTNPSVLVLRALKRTLAHGNPEFLSNRQQCAHEYFGHVLETVGRQETALREKGVGTAVEDAYVHLQTTRIQCSGCGGTSYHHNKARDVALNVPGPVPVATLSQCIKATFGESTVENFACPRCDKRTTATTRTGLRTFPQVMVMVVRRFGHTLPGSWVPVKLGTEISFKGLHGKDAEGDILTPGDPKLDEFSHTTPILSLSDVPELALNGPLEGEDLLPTVTSRPTKAPVVELDEEAALNLSEMLGVDIERVAYALRQCNNDPERAADWIFSHIDEAIPEETGGNTAEVAEASTSAVEPFENGEVKYVLRSFVSHQGPSTSCGHYIAHVFMDKDMTDGKKITVIDSETGEKTQVDHPGWVCYNDHRTFLNPHPPIGGAYIYFFEKQV